MLLALHGSKMPTVGSEIRVLAIVAEAFGGRGGIAQSTRDVLSAAANVTQIGQIDVFPRIVRGQEFEIPEHIVQHPAVSMPYLYSTRVLLHSYRMKPDLIYCGHAFMSPLAHLAARVSGAKVISHVHGIEVWQPLKNAARKGLSASDVILCVSHFTAEKVAATSGAPAQRCKVIYNTVEERFTPGDRLAARRRFKVNERQMVLSTVARLDAGQQHKGHDLVIRLLATLKKEKPDIVYLIAGTGDDLPRLEALADTHGVRHLVRFLGYVPDDDLPDLYLATDLYVMPSQGEGFGIAFVEAMACGTPALGLKVGGAEDALCDGVLGHAVTEATFPAALEEILSKPLPNRDALSRKVHRMFGRPQFEKRLLEAIAPVLEPNRARKK